MDFVHLHMHSHYSLLDGLSRIPDMVALAKEKGMKALALTDHGNMYGAIEFYKACVKAGIKPIVGQEMYMANRGRNDRTPKLDDSPYHLILLAKNDKGYRNLLQLTTKAHLEGFYYKPRIDFELLQQHHEGLIALSACLGGHISQSLLSNRHEEAEMLAAKYKEIFGPDYYLELQHHPHIPEQATVNEGLKALAKKLSLPLVATCDSHYLHHDDAEAHDVLLCLQTKRKQNEKGRMSMMHDDFSFDTEGVMKAFADTPEAIGNTVRIAEACNLTIQFEQPLLPRFPLPEGETAFSLLQQHTERGLTTRYKEVTPEIRERLNYELSVIEKTGFAPYFLIVWDLVKWAKDHGIMVGPGRGSAAGSIVSYLLGITQLDPIHYKLVFERFLNIERICMPDIDMDFTDTRRNEVIQYLEHKYGADHVAQIVTFGTMAARVSVRDVGRVLDVPYSFCDALAKMIPAFSTLEEALRDNPELKTMYDTNAQAKKIIDTSKKLEGVVRHASTHACGIVVGPEPLPNHTPLQYASTSDRTIISQYEMHAVEALGLLKIDLLGLKNLTLLENVKAMIARTRHINIDLNNIPLDNKETIRLLQHADTTGVFQLESAGMKKYLKQLKPTGLEDIIAMVALYRPGPMELINDYIDGKHGKRDIHYLHPALKPILEKTYGIAVYQEQVLQIARDLAGFSYGQADLLRKAMGKKIMSLLQEQKKKFMDGCTAKGVSQKVAEQVFAFMEPFAGYAFNRAHAACYAYIAWHTAYLKAHYTPEFMACLLTMDCGDLDRVAALIDECSEQHLEVLPPDINESEVDFTVVGAISTKPQIRFGLNAIKNVGTTFVENLLKERTTHGPFTALEDFLLRMSGRDLNKKSLEALIKSGAMQALGEKAQLLYNIQELLHFSPHKVVNISQLSLFATPAVAPSTHLPLKEAPEAARLERMHWEKEVLGLYLSEHPFSEYTALVEGRRTPLKTLKEERTKGTTIIAGIVTTIKKIFTKKGDAMLFARLEDESDHIEAVVFPKFLAGNSHLFQEGNPVRLKGKTEISDEGIKFFPDQGELLVKPT